MGRRPLYYFLKEAVQGSVGWRVERIILRFEQGARSLVAGRFRECRTCDL
jgi:hypothetical protein